MLLLVVGGFHAVLAAFMLFQCMTKKAAPKYSPAKPIPDASQSKPATVSKERSEDDEKSRGGSLMNPVLEKSSQNAVHIDCTHTIVPAEIPESDQKSILKAIKRQKPQKGTTVVEKVPMIEKVVAYGTSDDITVVGSYLQIRRSERGSAEPTSSSSVSTEVTESLLAKLIKNGARQFPFQFDELVDLLTAATSCLAGESSLLEVPVPCVVYGDIHGQYSDLLRWFNLNGWPHKTRSVFLGDFVDRGSHGIEVVALLVALKLAFPQQMYICRGNHEEESLNKVYSFYEEVCLRFPSTLETVGKDGPVMYSHFKKLFMQIPLAALIGGRILSMHGGISPKMESVDSIRKIERPIDDFEVGSLACDLVWSDPDTDPEQTGFRPNLDREPQHGIGQLFAAEAVKSLCRRLGIDFIIRGHQAPLHGYALFADGRLMTLFSAPGYKGSTMKDVNMGACVEVHEDMVITIKQLKVSEKFRKNRAEDVERMKASRKLARKLREARDTKKSKTDSCTE
ncbi:hypothetical protein L596_019097 [Steinernema carpocapsae]|uniref:protein-serine/threonine phosphatase n=1 Tax=Steinernema carpocapsae TaxID=34508 RepID=A0A4U5N7A3_STECR|nr:hypothetical protein L596_019097 [Steinernema carpocapsae]